MNNRQIKKQDKRAMAILVGAYGYKPASFAVDDEGKHVDYWWSCSHECVEYDSKPAYEEWQEIRSYEHPNFERWYGFDPDTGKDIPEDQKPRRMGRREARKFYRLVPPPGYCWRGKHVVKDGRIAWRQMMPNAWRETT
jgi:hypothetical protein